MRNAVLEAARAIRRAEVKDKKWEREQVAPYPEYDALNSEDQKRYLAMARAAIVAIRVPTNQMINAGEAWRNHCSDTDSLFEEMISAALHPESYPAEPHPLYT